MNISELAEKIRNAGIDEDAVCLNSPPIWGMGLYCIIDNKYCWEVSFSERGEKNSIKNFLTESEACEYFWKWIIGDESIFLNS